jgi:hypothetical protein
MRTVQRDLNSLRRYCGADLHVVGDAVGYRYRWNTVPFQHLRSSDSTSKHKVGTPVREACDPDWRQGANGSARKNGCSEDHLRATADARRSPGSGVADCSRVLYETRIIRPTPFYEELQE